MFAAGFLTSRLRCGCRSGDRQRTQLVRRPATNPAGQEAGDEPLFFV